MSIRRYLAYVLPYWKQILGTILIGIIKFAIPLALPLLIKYVIDDLLPSPLPQEEKLKQLFWLMLGAILLFTVVRAPVEYIRQYYAQWVSSRILFDIRNQLFSHLQRLSMRYYNNTKTGEVISRVINDVESTKSFVETGLMNLWLDLITITLTMGIMLYMDVELTIVAIIVFPLYSISVKFFYKRLRQLTKDRSAALAHLQGYLYERVNGMSLIRSFALEKQESKEFAKENNQFLDKALAHTRWNARTFAVVNTVTDIAPLLVIAYAGYQVIGGGMSVGTLVAFYAYLERLYTPLRRLVNSSTVLTQAIASMDRMFEFIDESYDIVDKPNAGELPVDPATKRIRGEIRFENVSFRYREEGPLVLNNVNLSISSGETVAIVGMSGGGKSSLISLLPRFWDVTEGKITIDGIDIRDVKQQNLRHHIGMVQQDNILFSESAKVNILMGNPDADDNAVQEAAKAANAHDFISELPNGYHTELGERGVKLSGGQKQRIAIARVFLRDPGILILDEATSALDLESEHTIQESLSRLTKGRTTLIVAHRLSTITHADKIIVMKEGQIVEEGTHEQLLERKGVYYGLWSVQDLGGTSDLQPG
ncbi:ABC transporter ATP-binding protein [Brevibacillus formosus]|uniref:ABC transporter ATP-binding protein n=1 Tax=Brevibacillus TaxID=55080 RepID=UPI000D0FA0F7|nr:MULTISPECIES: ABC transporter ATP-binding protein [Brevibacillus]MBG9941487.1 multidrug ABC transporter ATP-binding protein [Brevibacillus formosus]MED1948749.1 ABC transporter ATP-binding protein [Brevibacillus formosus]MED2001272.1 ABC transporter ATP-binding protein [Brevibacillus formosus]MED2085356.1 ABC transporter ATP-binding protein [Brevibacillus formosus]PSK20834.1 multidrug ABC transporter ATP-binding protein [Brevibacillus sp. NRRL NRS-603]